MAKSSARRRTLCSAMSRPVTVFLNGSFVEPDSATISALDAGVQHGVGVFDTLLGGVSAATLGRRAAGAPLPTDALEGVWAVQLEEHVERIADSARQLGLSAGVSRSALAEAVLATLDRAALPRARVRVTLTAGPSDALAAARAGAGPAGELPGTVMIVATPATRYPPSLMRQGVRVSIADARANPFNPTEGHKTLGYWWRLRELASAASKHAAEALVFSVTNHLCGGCVSSVLLIRDGQALTPIARGEEAAAIAEPRSVPALSSPALPSPVLPGITRLWAIQELAGAGVVTHRRALTIRDVLDAHEILLTNSSWGVLPVASVEAEPVGSGPRAGKVGPLGAMLADRWQEMLVALSGEGGHADGELA
ncbi:MAG: hypothetical protein C0475_02090 [Planctomyces sp.]|nr:hypothetical protein [Planctomyces sp.]MBA4119848.1 hypothetical protein [Isosphaera sp.]